MGKLEKKAIKNIMPLIFHLLGTYYYTKFPFLLNYIIAAS
jgi:hypothetical protein